jgi:predicted PurR-regulated permease PerM
LVGEHLYGILGVILAIPVAASIKVVYGFILDKINEAERKEIGNRE